MIQSFDGLLFTVLNKGKSKGLLLVHHHYGSLVFLCVAPSTGLNVDTVC